LAKYCDRPYVGSNEVYPIEESKYAKKKREEREINDTRTNDLAMQASESLDNKARLIT
jgi:hypothetical protein